MGFSLNPLSDISSALHAGEKLAGKALHAGETVAEDGAKGFAGAMKDAAKAVTQMSPSEIGHTVLNVAGMIPVIGAPADAINAGWYAAQGDWKDAALSAATAIPGVGDFAGGARLGTTALKIAEDGAKIAEDGVKAERAIKGGKEVASTAENAEKALNADKTAERLRNADGTFALEPRASDVRHSRETEYPHGNEPSVQKQVIAKHTNANGEVIDPQTGQVIPKDQLTIEHSRPVVDHWNKEGYNQSGAERKQWYNKQDNLTVKPQSVNSSEGAKLGQTFRQGTGPNYKP
jgi:hypothetical protein